MEPINIENNRQEALAHAIEFAGPQATFFAQHQARIIASIAKQQNLQPKNVLDYGCGDGTLTFLLHQQMPQAHVHGVDSSQELIEIAQEWHGKPTLRYPPAPKAPAVPGEAKGEAWADKQPSVHFYWIKHLENRLSSVASCEGGRDYDLIYLANVLHHILKQEHKKVIKDLLKHLAPKGMLIILEFNPYNVVQAWRFYWNKEEKGNKMVWPGYVKKLVAPYGMAHTQFFKNGDCLPQTLRVSRYLPSTSLYGVTIT